MRLDSTHTSTVLEQLRKTFNATDVFSGEPGRSRDFADQVKSDVEEIARLRLHENVSGWGTRCKNRREKHRYTLQEVAGLLDVSHRTIQHEEGRDKSTTIELFYLEAFSLIYHISPYSLIGAKSPHIVSPMQSVDTQLSQHHNVIMSFLYKENDPQKLRHLEIITHIAKLYPSAFQLLISFLKNTKTFSRVLKKDPTQHPNANDKSWGRNAIKPKLDADQRSSEEYWRRKVYWEAHLVLEDVEQHFPERMSTLAKLAVCNEQAAAYLADIITNIGFPKDHKSLRIYHYDKMIINPAPGTSQYSTGRGFYRNGSPETSNEDPADNDSSNIKQNSDSSEPKNCSSQQHCTEAQSNDKSSDPLEKEGKSPHSVQTTSSLEDGISRTQKPPLQQAFMYCPYLHSGSPFQKSLPDSAITFIYGNATELTEFLLNLRYTSTHTSGSPLHTEDESPIEYRISLADRCVQSKIGTAELTEEQITKLFWIIDDIDTELLFSPIPPNPASNSN